MRNTDRSHYSHFQLSVVSHNTSVSVVSVIPPKDCSFFCEFRGLDPYQALLVALGVRKLTFKKM